MDDVVVGPLDLIARVDDALAVQALAFGLTDEEVGVRRHIVQRHMTSRGARALGATAPDGRLVGFAYGMPNDRATGGPRSSNRICAVRAGRPGSTTPSSSPNCTSSPTTRNAASAAG